MTRRPDHLPKKRSFRRGIQRPNARRRLRIESLEQRQLLTTVTQLTDGASEVTQASVQDMDGNAARVVLQANLTLGDVNPEGLWHVMLHDRNEQWTIPLTSSNRGPGTQSARDMGGSIDASGTRVVFSSPDDLLPGQNLDGGMEVFLYETASGSFTQLTHSDNGDSVQPAISGDGQWVAFVSTANLAGDNPDANREIFRLHISTGALAQITVSSDGTSEGPAISGDGTRIAFESNADLTGDNSDGSTEVYYYDAEALSLAQLSSSETGMSRYPSMDAEGNTIVFTSNASPVSTSTANELLHYDVPTAQLQQITDNSAKSLSALTPRVSDDGSRVSFMAITDTVSLAVFVHDLQTEQTYPVAETVAYYTPSTILQMLYANAVSVPVSADGEHVTFSVPDDFVGMNTDGGLEVFAATDFDELLIRDQQFHLDENSQTGTVVGQVPRLDPTASLEFEITAGNDEGIFAIDGASGEISIALADGLDHEVRGAVTLTVKATDSNGPSVFDYATIVIHVDDVNEPPLLVRPIDDQIVMVGESWEWSIPYTTFQDEDAGDSLTYSAAREDGTPLPDWLQFDAVDHVFHGTPAEGDVGDLAVTVTANDGGDPSLSAAGTFTVSVIDNLYPWQNPRNRYDVDAKDGVTPLDALIIINLLNEIGAGDLPGSGVVAPPYVDVAGNNHLEPLDALMVINYLNEQLMDVGEGEGESDGSIVSLSKPVPETGTPASDAFFAEQPSFLNCDDAPSGLDPVAEVTAEQANQDYVVGEAGQDTSDRHDDALMQALVEDGTLAWDQLLTDVIGE